MDILLTLFLLLQSVVSGSHQDQTSLGKLWNTRLLAYEQQQHPDQPSEPGAGRRIRSLPRIRKRMPRGQRRLRYRLQRWRRTHGIAAQLAGSHGTERHGHRRQRRQRIHYFKTENEPCKN